MPLAAAILCYAMSLYGSRATDGIVIRNDLRANWYFKRTDEGCQSSGGGVYNKKYICWWLCEIYFMSALPLICKL